MKVPPVLAAMRTATQGVHRALEAATYGDRILGGSLQPREYRKLMKWQRRTHRSLEPLVMGFHSGDYAYRPRFAASAGPPPAPSLPERIGLLYVLEGSSLGGSLIHRKLLDNPNLADEGPFSFYQQQAEWGLAQWRAYTKALATITLTEEEVQSAVRSALRAFARFRNEWEALD
jgi:heme oxygenase